MVLSPPLTLSPRIEGRSKSSPDKVGHGADVLVAPAGVDQNGLVWGASPGQLHGKAKRGSTPVRDDPLGTAQIVEGIECLLVGDAHVLRTADFLQPGMFGATPGSNPALMLCVSVIWPFSSCRMKVRLPCSTPLEPRCRLAECLPLSRPSPAASTPIRPFFERYVGGRCPWRCCRRPAGDHGIGLLGRDLLFGQHGGHLREALGADHALEVAHHHGVGVGPATVPMM